MKKLLLPFIFLALFFSTATVVFAQQAESPVGDITAPIITLLGEPSITLEVGGQFTDPGATAVDDVDGDVTSHITVSGTVDATQVGKYTLSYSVSDTAGNSAAEKVRTISVTAPAAKTVTLLVRKDDSVIFSGPVPLSDQNTVSITDTAGVAHEAGANSVLGLLYRIDQSDDTFSLSKIAFYSSFNSLYLSCITYQSTEYCDNWQYAIGQTAPSLSMDQAKLVGGESVGVYFGNPHRLVLSSTEITQGESFNAKAEKYNYESNTWLPLQATIGVTAPNPDDPYTPTILSEQHTNAEGSSSITIATPGTYGIGIAEDFYFPTYPLVVKAPPLGGGGGGGIAIIIPTHKMFDVEKATDFLLKLQTKEGSFGKPMINDWVAIGLAKLPKADITLLKKNITDWVPDGNLPLTEYERHAMALEALTVDPYTGTKFNYIKKILSDFDGKQFGDPTLYNDDIFAIIPLTHAGYTVSDNEIQKAVDFILSKQHDDGSWDGVDITAAAIEALRNVSELPKVALAIEKGLKYLQNTQLSDGGYGSSFSTSWVLGLLREMNIQEYEKNNLNLNDYLCSLQASDGGLETTSNSETRIWATTLAIPSALGFYWNNSLSSFQKQTLTDTSIDTIVSLEVTPESTSTLSDKKPTVTEKYISKKNSVPVPIKEGMVLGAETSTSVSATEPPVVVANKKTKTSLLMQLLFLFATLSLF